MGSERTRRERKLSGGLVTHRRGTGPRVILVHGGVMDGASGWVAQPALADRWELIAVDRCGYGGSASLSEGEDLELDAELLGPLLEQPAHLVGHSSGAVAVMLAAAKSSSAIRSLTLLEPPTFQLAASAVAREAQIQSDVLFDSDELDPYQFMRRFQEIMGSPPLADQVVSGVIQGITTWRRFKRRPWDAELPLDALAKRDFPCLVVSGGYNEAFEEVCDALATRLGAERAQVVGAGHFVQAAPGFNDLLERFIGAAERQPL